MFKREPQAAEGGQIQDSKGVSFFVLNAPYRLFSAREVIFLTMHIMKALQPERKTFMN
jgi:hypothetical protein